MNVFLLLLYLCGLWLSFQQILMQLLQILNPFVSPDMASCSPASLSIRSCKAYSHKQQLLWLLLLQGLRWLQPKRALLLQDQVC